MTTDTDVTKKTFGQLTGELALVLALMPFSMLWHAFVLVKLWAWFITPIFLLPPLSIVPAIGLSLVVSYLTAHNISKMLNDEKRKSIGHKTFVAICYPAVVLGVGYVISLFL